MIAPKTPEQIIAYIDGQITAGYRSLGDALQAKRISKSQGQKIFESLDGAGAASDLAKGLDLKCKAGDPASCDETLLKIKAAQAILAEIEKQLRAKQ